jgi:hypothetical protein
MYTKVSIQKDGTKLTLLEERPLQPGFEMGL